MKWWLNLATDGVPTLAGECHKWKNDGIRDVSLFIPVTSKTKAAFAVSPECYLETVCVTQKVFS